MKRLPTINCCTPLAGASLSEADAVELESLFRVLADRNRLKIMNILLRAGGQAVCVCEFLDHLDLAQPTVGYHLKQRASRLARIARSGALSPTSRCAPRRCCGCRPFCRPNRSPRPADVSNVLFVCIQNAGRSQIAEGSSTRPAGRSTVPGRRAAGPPITSTRPSPTRCASSDSISPRKPRTSSPKTTCNGPTSWSPWAAATSAHTSRASATSTGNRPPRRPADRDGA